MANKFPTKPKRSQQFSILSGEIVTPLNLNLPPVVFKPYVPDKAMLRAWARAADPYKREAGDGRGE